MIRFSKLAAALAVLPVLAVASPVFAGSPGQLAQGAGLYQVKNISQNGAYASTASAAACEEVQYSMMLSNTDFSSLNNVMLAATLPANGGVSTATATTELGGNTGAHDSVTVTIPAGQTISYEAGSTKLFDDKGNVIKTLPDGITGSGVNVGTILGSTTEFVNFRAKVGCPQPPVVSLACTELTAAQIDRTRYDLTVKSSVSNATVTSYVFTTKNASGTVVDTTTVTTSASSAVYHFNQSTAGTYTVSAVVNTDHGSAGGSNCVKQITVAAVPPTTPTPTPTTPAAIPNTGAGDVLGIFAGASAAGTAAHAIVSRRRR